MALLSIANSICWICLCPPSDLAPSAEEHLVGPADLGFLLLVQRHLAPKAFPNAEQARSSPANEAMISAKSPWCGERGQALAERRQCTVNEESGKLVRLMSATVHWQQFKL